jgi:putative hydrolase
MHNHFHTAYFISAYELLSSKKIPKWDFHIHTYYSDGEADVLQIFEKAIEQELEIIVFTEHTELWRTDKTDWFKCYVEEIKKYREVYQDKIKAFIGVEANAVSFDGDIELTDQMNKYAEFILGAVHRYPGLEGRKIHDLSKAEAIDLEYKTLMGLAAAKEIDAIAHIGATCSKYCTPFPRNLSREIARVATKNHIAIEINPVYHKPLMGFLEMCAEEKAMVTLGSDAHKLNDVGLIVREMKSALKT